MDINKYVSNKYAIANDETNLAIKKLVFSQYVTYRTVWSTYIFEIVIYYVPRNSLMK